MTKSQAVGSEPVEGQDEAIKRTADEIIPLLIATDAKHALARYTLGQRVNDLESKYGHHTVDKLAKALGRNFGPDNLRMFARIARKWTMPKFEMLVERGLDISDFRELAKLADDTTRARVEQEAIENAWPIETLKEEVRKVAGSDEYSPRRKKVAQVRREVPMLTVTDALNALITEKQLRVDEQARLRTMLDQIDPQAAQALAIEINKAIEAVRAQRAALDATEQLLVAALRLPTGVAA